jgi:hypothetical protein
MVAVIDLDSIAYAIGWGKKVIIDYDSNGEPIYQRDEKGRLIYEDKTEVELLESTDYVMNDVLTKCGATEYIAYIKGKNTGAHRYKVNVDYKANRIKESPKWWDSVKSYLVDRWGAISVDNYEVDDYVATTAKLIPGSFIVAIDKDLLHLEGNHYNWKTDTWTSVSAEDAALYFWTDMITGQVGDCIKGIPRKGAAFAKNLFEGLQVSDLGNAVSDAYQKHFGNSDEFEKNFICLTIATDMEGFTIPNTIQYKSNQLERGLDE